jgi:hypothetical protein
MALGVRRSFGIGALELAAASRATLDVPLTDEAELWLARPDEDAIAPGAFQRPALDAPLALRRGSGGPAVRMGPGTLWLALLLPRVGALVACDEARLVNRYVRPLLKALAKCGTLAHFFGRDWISVEHRPAAWIGFAHDSTTGRAAVEAFIARSTPFDAGPRDSYVGKEPGTLASITGAVVEEARLADAIVAAYAAAYGRAAIDRGAIAVSPALPAGRGPGGGVIEDPPWLATIPETIGPLGAGPDATGRFRIGGDLLVSRDALFSLETSVATARDEDLDLLIDTTLRAPHVALDGVRSLTSVRDVIVAARRVSSS